MYEPQTLIEKVFEAVGLPSLKSLVKRDMQRPFGLGLGLNRERSNSASEIGSTGGSEDAPSGLEPNRSVFLYLYDLNGNLRQIGDLEQRSCQDWLNQCSFSTRGTPIY